jgi:NADH-quinone oxidoreductase subunit C
MSLEQILDALKSRFAVLSASVGDGIVNAEIERHAARNVLTFLRDEGRFDLMTFLTAVDRPAENRLEVVYQLFSYSTKIAARIRFTLKRDAAVADTVSDIYRTADWHERETAEMFGITFSGHPDPRKLLLPEDLEGFPLRKDFTNENLIPLPEVT